MQRWRVDQRQVVDIYPCRMYSGVCASGRQLRRDKIEAQAIGARNQMNESFEMGCRYGPAERREIILVVEDRHIAVQRVLTRISNLSIDEKYFLMNLGRRMISLESSLV